MRKITLAIAASLDGFIARRDGSVDWISPADDAADFNQAELMADVDTVIMGRRTWDIARDRAGGSSPFAGKRCVVFSRRRAGLRQGRTQFTDEDPETCVRRLRQTSARSGSGGIWLVGGGEIVRECLDAAIVNEVVLTLVPVLLGDGVPLFLPRGGTTWLKLTECRSFPDGRVLLRYQPAGVARPHEPRVERLELVDGPLTSPRALELVPR
jgi:dihydrofolate reductase